MSRLIDADDLKQSIAKKCGASWNFASSLNPLLKMIDKQPSVHPEIIVCANCKHWICHDRRCGYWNHGVRPLEWCCHAERRTDE